MDINEYKEKIQTPEDLSGNGKGFELDINYNTLFKDLIKNTLSELETFSAAAKESNMVTAILSEIEMFKDYLKKLSSTIDENLNTKQVASNLRLMFNQSLQAVAKSNNHKYFVVYFAPDPFRDISLTVKFSWNESGELDLYDIFE
jgi:hypothetical protein